MRPPMPTHSNEVYQREQSVHTVHAPPTRQHSTQASQHLHSHTYPLSQQGLEAQQIEVEQQKNKLPPLELLVEHKLSYTSAASYHQQQQKPKQPIVPSSKTLSNDLGHSFKSPLSSDNCLSTVRASIFDDGAENFIINFPADSSLQLQPLLPLSETLPLLTYTEAFVVDQQQQSCLDKNSASLIFTKKELGANSNISQSHSSGEHQSKQPKHLPSTQRGQHHRHSLQLIYNTNLVPTAACATGEKNGSNSKLVPIKHQSQTHTHSGAGLTSTTSNSSGAIASARKQLSYSWYAPVYCALEEELEQDSRDSSPIHNLANTKHQQRAASSQQSGTAPHAAPPLHDSDTNETVALLETHTRSKINIITPSGAGAECKASSQPRISLSLPNSKNYNHSHSVSSLSNATGTGTETGTQGTGAVVVDVESSLGLSTAQLPRRRRFENFLKSLVGLKGSSSSGSGSREKERGNERDREPTTNLRPASPEIRITRTPSEQDVVLRDSSTGQQEKLANGTSSSRLSISGSTSSLNVVQQKLWHMLRREGSASSLHQEKSQSIVQYTGLRKCETVLALTRQSHSMNPKGCNERTALMLTAQDDRGWVAGGVEPIRPLNRLRHSVNSINGGAGGTCSRCSSLLSLAATGSRYSLANSFVARPESLHSLNSSQQIRRTSLSPEEQKKPMHINVNAQIRLSNGCKNNNAVSATLVPSSRRSSASLHSISSPSPPSNVTTATLHSTYTNNNNSNSVAIEEQVVTPSSASGVDMGAFGTTHAYPLTVSSLLSMASANQAAQACCVRDGITLERREMLASTEVTPLSGTPSTPITLPSFQPFTCKLCLIDVENGAEATTLLHCGCQFCTECMRAYVDFEITEGAYEISCPDAKCPSQGAISLTEIANLSTTNLLKKHHRYRLNREIELDKTRTWCPRAGCETICKVNGNGVKSTVASAAAVSGSSICQMEESPSTSHSYIPQLDGVTPLLSVSVHCPSCNDEFCALCKKAYHPNINCEEFGRRLIADGQDDIGIPFDNELIKCCPMCAVPIEKDEGCAQMMCKRCKHVFCWYCLASLDDDFLLRHYDKGPCKNKLGHSRASVVWHRAQVIGIFAGFGILLLVASPLLLLAAPCIICCKCRGCSGSKIDEVDAELEEEVTALHG